MTYWLRKLHLATSNVRTSWLYVPCISIRHFSSPQIDLSVNTDIQPFAHPCTNVIVGLTHRNSCNTFKANYFVSRAVVITCMLVTQIFFSFSFFFSFLIDYFVFFISVTYDLLRLPEAISHCRFKSRICHILSSLSGPKLKKD